MSATSEEALQLGVQFKGPAVETGREVALVIRLGLLCPLHQLQGLPLRGGLRRLAVGVAAEHDVGAEDVLRAALQVQALVQQPGLKEEDAEPSLWWDGGNYLVLSCRLQVVLVSQAGVDAQEARLATFQVAIQVEHASEERLLVLIATEAAIAVRAEEAAGGVAAEAE